MITINGQDNTKPRSLLSSLDFRYDKRKDVWIAQSDYVRKVMLDIPLKDKRIYSYSYEDVSERFPFLKSYQINDVITLAERGRGLNANRMGAGKTVETLCTLELLECSSILIICPKSVMGNWRKEILKWTNTNKEDIQLIYGTPNKRIKSAKMSAKYYIINYESLRNQRGELFNILRKKRWDCIVTDEAHRIKNKDAKQTKGVKVLKAKHKYALTGTPIQNKPDDLWSILHWIDPEISGRSYWRFVECFCELEEDFFGVKIKGLVEKEQNKKALITLLDSIMIRNEYVPDFPEYITVPIEILPSNSISKMYKKIREEILISLNEEEVLFINSALTRMLRLQQLTSCPPLFDIKDNPKMDFIKDLLEDTDEKIVIYSRFVSVINNIRDSFPGKVVTLTGETDDRDATIAKFKEDDSIRIFASTIGAGGEGIDGLQEVSSILIFVDQDYSPSKNSQVIGRLVRTGQKNLVTVLILQMKDTIDEYVESLISRKMEDIIAVLEKSA